MGYILLQRDKGTFEFHRGTTVKTKADALNECNRRKRDMPAKEFGFLEEEANG